MASVRGFVVGPMGNNTYVIYDNEAKVAVVVDPSMESERVLDWIRLQGLTVLSIVNTHGHTDHTFNNAYFLRETGAQLVIHQADEPMLSRGPGRWMGEAEPSPAPDGYLTDGQELFVGALTVRVLETPGHTPQDITTLVSTDDGLVALTHLWWRSDSESDPLAVDPGALHANRERVLGLATKIVPGHGALFAVTAATLR